jgi:hypothetical protein
MNKEPIIEDSYTAAMALRLVFPRSRNKYLRLLFLVADITLIFTIATLLFGYFRDFGFALAPLSFEQIVARLGQAIASSAFAAVWLGLIYWLALEKFDKRRKKSFQSSVVNKASVNRPLPKI